MYYEKNKMDYMIITERVILDAWRMGSVKLSSDLIDKEEPAV